MHQGDQLVRLVLNGLGDEWRLARPDAGRGSSLHVRQIDEDDQRALAGLLPKLLARLYAQVGNAQHMCRFCDRTCCTAGAACPVGEAERQEQSS